MRADVRVWLAFIVAACVGCDASRCSRHSDCDVGLVCGAAATCVPPPDAMTTADAALADAALADAALTDAALADAALADASEAP
jgi:hypothetical protein